MNQLSIAIRVFVDSFSTKKGKKQTITFFPDKDMRATDLLYQSHTITIFIPYLSRR